MAHYFHEKAGRQPPIPAIAIFRRALQQVGAGAIGYPSHADCRRWYNGFLSSRYSMRADIVIDDELLVEAMQPSQGCKTKK